MGAREFDDSLLVIRYLPYSLITVIVNDLIIIINIMNLPPPNYTEKYIFAKFEKFEKCLLFAEKLFLPFR